MSKKENQSLNEIVKQIESLQTAIETLKEGLDEEKTFKFTNKQLLEFVDLLYGNFKQFYGDEISGIDFTEEVVRLDLDGTVILPSVDSNMIASEIEDYISDPTTDQIENMVNEVLEQMEI